MFVRVRDKDTGHHYDLDERDSRIADGTVEVLKDREPHERYQEPQHAADLGSSPHGRTRGTTPSKES